MSLRNLPQARAPQRPKFYNGEAPSDALGLWAEGPHAADANDPNIISIYDVIGEDWWTGGGFTAKRMSGALRAIGSNPVTVAINSPGGDMFEGIAIYNMLREHPAKVTVKVMGYAASAASVIAMAGDEILMGIGSQMMIHNAWGVAIGNKHDFKAALDLFTTFDSSMVEIYSARTGLDDKSIAAMMDGDGKAADGTWMTAKQAVDKGFADGLTDDAAPDASASVRPEIAAKRRIDGILAKEMPRSERRRLFAEAAGTRNATGTAMRTAGADLNEGLKALIHSMKS